MNEKLDLVEILKDCPKGTKFYSSYLGKNVIFIEIYDNHIKCEYSSQIDSLNCSIQFRKDGSLYPEGECMIFPSKDQKDWSKWQRTFVDGDIVFYNDTIAIFKEWDDETLFRTYVTKYLCCDSLIDTNVCKEIRFATEEEKEKLFQYIKDNGYKWNADTKTLEKMIVPKFKVGDSIQSKTDNNDKFTITNIDNDKFYYGCRKRYEFMIPVEKQDNWELVPKKFDPRTLRSFDKVLVTDSLSKAWYAVFLSHIDEESKTYPFAAGVVHYRYCIPYNNDTKHLAGKPGEPPEFYKYWEE